MDDIPHEIATNKGKGVEILFDQLSATKPAEPSRVIIELDVASAKTKLLIITDHGTQSLERPSHPISASTQSKILRLTDKLVEQLYGLLADVSASPRIPGCATSSSAQLHSLSRNARSGRGSAELVPWRLKRVITYIEEHLPEPLPLADLAKASGLSKMYFAAQFRASTGLRPHEYVVRCRILRAKLLLECTGDAIVDIAGRVGFQTQAHFSTRFKRQIGYTPAQWRALSEAGRTPQNSPFHVMRASATS